MADTIIGAHDGTFKTEGSISMRETQEFLSLREGLSASSFESPGLAGSISLQKLYDASNAGEIVLAGNAAYPSSNYSLGGLRGSSYQNNTPPVIDLLGPSAFFVNNVAPSFGVPESYALNMQVCDPDVDFEIENWKYDNEHYVATCIFSSTARTNHEWTYDLQHASAVIFRAFFDAGHSSAAAPSYPNISVVNGGGHSVGWGNLFDLMDQGFKNNILSSNHCVGYIGRRVYRTDQIAIHNGKEYTLTNHWRWAIRDVYSQEYNNSALAYNSWSDSQSHEFGKFCIGPSSWGRITYEKIYGWAMDGYVTHPTLHEDSDDYYDPFQPSAIAYKENKDSGLIGATDSHAATFNSLSAPDGKGYYLHPIKIIS